MRRGDEDAPLHSPRRVARTFALRRFERNGRLGGGWAIDIRKGPALEQVGARLNRSAPEGFCGVGRRKARLVSGNTGKPFDEPTTQKTPALRVAFRRAPAASPRSAVLPDTPFARLLADHLAGTQRSRFNLAPTCSNRAFASILEIYCL